MILLLLMFLRTPLIGFQIYLLKRNEVSELYAVLFSVCCLLLVCFTSSELQGDQDFHVLEFHDLNNLPIHFVGVLGESYLVIKEEDSTYLLGADK